MWSQILCALAGTALFSKVYLNEAIDFRAFVVQIWSRSNPKLRANETRVVHRVLIKRVVRDDNPARMLRVNLRVAVMTERRNHRGRFLLETKQTQTLVSVQAVYRMAPYGGLPHQRPCRQKSTFFLAINFRPLCGENLVT